MSGRFVLLCAILTAAPFAQAQAPDPAAQAQLIQQLLQRIDRLENRVTELESGKSAALVERTPTPPPAPPVIAQTGVHDHGTPVEPPTTFPSLRLSGFGDVNFVASDQK